MNKIYIDEVKISKHRIDYVYRIEGEWKKYFTEIPFFVEYNQDISEVPKSLAVIPILGTILPMSWVYDAEIEIKEIDKTFYESIPQFKQGYIDMYPMLELKGKLKVDQIVENSKIDRSGNSACLFSGGADAFQTLITHLEEKPMLVSIWGADVNVDNHEGWEVVRKHIESTAEENGIRSILVKSSFRKSIDEGKLHRYVIERSGDGWWHGFHHGVGMLTLVAPIAYECGLDYLYIASSFTIADKGKVTCASDPSIDNFVKFCQCQVVHDGYEFTRQQKIHRICEYVKKTGKQIPLRVCWKSTSGTNCCRCEKCYRTILAIYAEGEDPRQYGFEYTDKEFKRMMWEFKYSEDPAIGVLRYEPIQKVMRKNYKYGEVLKELKWFYKVDISKIKEMPCRKKTFFWKGIRYIERQLL